MRKLAFALVALLQILALTAFAADECTLCIGLATTEPAGVLTLARVAIADLATFAPAEPRNVSVVVEYTAADLAEVEQQTKTIIDWARAHGPFDSLGVSVPNADATLAAYAIKRLSVSAQGQGVATRIVMPRTANLGELFENGAATYFDALIVDASEVAETVVWLAERDPSKKIFAVVPVTSPNALFDLGQALAAGATRAYASGAANAQALAQFNRSMTGDWAYDSTSTIPVLDAKGMGLNMPVLTFVRGEDLRTVLIARGDAAAPSILALPADRFTKPRRIDAAGEREITDT
ncbi:MAG TPA: hypothetical protein VF215_15165, partial [Thermoanaerobaculia bacterium]